LRVQHFNPVQDTQNKDIIKVIKSKNKCRKFEHTFSPTTIIIIIITSHWLLCLLFLYYFFLLFPTHTNIPCTTLFNRIGKFLRHPSTLDDDDDDDDSSNESLEEEEEDDEDIDQVLAMRKVQQRKDNARLSSESDDEDEDVDEDEEEEEVVGSKRKRGTVSKNKSSSKKRTGYKVSRKFFDEEAEASSDGLDDDDEEENYGYKGESRREREKHDVVKKHYTAEDIRRENMDAEAEELIRQQNLRRSKMPIFNSDLDAAEIARQIEQRHKMESRRLDYRTLDEASVLGGMDGGASGSGGIHDLAMSAVGQQSLLPSVSDPTMWMFSCSTGKEEELVYQIMNKCIAYAKQGKPLGITAVVAAQTKGRIFIESFSEPAVLEAVQGVRNLLIYTKRLVPITDMTTVMNVSRKKKPGMFVCFFFFQELILYICKFHQ